MALLWIYVCFFRISDKYWLMWINRASGFQKQKKVLYSIQTSSDLLMWIWDKMVILCQNPRGSAGIQKDSVFYTWIEEKKWYIAMWYLFPSIYF